MIGLQERKQHTLFLVGSMEDLIPDDYVLKQVNRVVDFSWIRHEVESLYCPQMGRPSIDPEAALRLMVAGFFLGIVNDRKLIRETQVNLALRWFAGYSLEDTIPEHSSLTRIRQRWGVRIFKMCFQRIVNVCLDHGLISAETVHIDATLIRANVSWDSVIERHVRRVVKVNKYAAREEIKKEKYIRTDPDASMATNSRSHRLEPSYKQHVAVDDRAGIIVDVAITTGTANEGDEVVNQVERIEQTLPLHIKHITADAGYAYGKVYAALEDRYINAIIPPKVIWSNKRVIPLHRFRYDAKYDRVRCPRKKILHKTSRCKHGWYYKAATSDCSKCPIREKCLSPKVNRRTVVISETYPQLLRARRRKNHWSVKDHYLYARHRWIAEGVHAEAKCNYGLNRAIRRGIENTKIQSYLTASVINLKRLSKAA